MLQQSAHCAWKKERKKSPLHSLSKSNSLRTGGSVHIFLRSFLPIVLSQSNGQTVPQSWCRTGKWSNSKGFVIVVLLLLLFLLFPRSTLGMRRRA